VLNLNGSSEFARLQPLLRTNSSDLADSETSTLDESLLSRHFSLPEEPLVIPTLEK